ncbi:MAG TPA: ABC transporter ATP-binding protein [bacterium]|nr:ABC transporter ATP-binding protein [bacterium]
MTRGILEVEGLSHAFGGVRAVAGCAFSLDAGRVGALIGPNGAGKSTVVNLLAGALPLQQGRIVFDGGDISRWPMYRIARRGLIRTFQLSREFGGLSVLENMLVPPPDQPGERLRNVLFRPSLGRREDRRHVSKALDVLNTFGLYVLRDQYARNLSGGEKRLLELARAVMAEPKLLVLDEPMAGVNPALVERLCEHILRLRESGITLLLVEHNLRVVDRICDQVIVMAYGRTLAIGQMAELRNDPEVVKAYLGGSVEA